MAVNPNIHSAEAGTTEGGASSAKLNESFANELQATAPLRSELWKRTKAGKVETHLHGALNALDSLIHKCRSQGTRISFRHALSKPEQDANRAAMTLIWLMLLDVEALLRQAEGEHITWLREELAAHEAHQTKSS